MKKNIVYGLLGTSLDNGTGGKRWDKWRPSVSICSQEDFIVDELHLIFQKKYETVYKQVVDDIKRISPETLIIPELIEFCNPWDFEEVYGALLDISEKISFDTDNCEYYFHITTGTHVAQICIFLLSESKYFEGRLIQTSPAYGTDKESGSYTIIDLDLSKYDRLSSRFVSRIKDDISFLKSGIETKNINFNKLIERIEKVAIRTSEPILLTGPTGAGKSMLARNIYNLRKSSNNELKEFIEINCSTLKGDLAISALFGHKKGSFTGANQDREGLLKAADKGILFLDEIGELGLNEQAMLLKAIEEKIFYPLGSTETERSDFQLICGTNKKLKNEVANGRFREDLLTRINLWTFRLPSLVERKEDIEPNIKYELDRISLKLGTKISFSKESMQRFLDFALSDKGLWKANFRDLNGSITRMAILCEGERISSEVVDEEIQRLQEDWSSIEEKGLIEKYCKTEVRDNMDLFDKIQLEEVLKICENSENLADAGRILFSESRKNKTKPNDSDRIRKYLESFGIKM